MSDIGLEARVYVARRSPWYVVKIEIEQSRQINKEINTCHVFVGTALALSPDKHGSFPHT